MGLLRRSLAIAVMFYLLILCSGCATQHGTAANIPAGPNVANIGGANTIPAGPSVVMPGTKHFTGVPY
jgi:hypothetical protein